TVSPQTALWTALAYLIASQLEANLIYPVIQKRAVSMSPALTLFAILAMGALFGPLGIVLATPLLVVISIFVIKLYVNKVLGDSRPAPGEGRGDGDNGEAKDKDAAPRSRGAAPGSTVG